MSFNRKATDYINGASENQIEILETLRQLIHSSIPDTTEDFKWRMPVFIKSKIFTYLRYSKEHVTLGFYNIERLKDPNKMLEGTGKTMRHIKIRGLEDIDKKLITEWLQGTAD